MAQITVQGPSDPPATYRFEQDRITVGRSEGNDLSLLNAALSRQHAVLRRERGRWLVEDLGSRNGTYLNGKRVEGSAPLLPGDEVGVGDFVLVFEASVLAVHHVTETTKSHVKAMRAATELVGASAAMKEVRSLVEKAAASTATVLVTGESGTGKELVAKLLHERSPRRSGPLVVVNCPALPGSLVEAELFGVEKGVATGVDARPGRLEQAAGGTLFLDEVGDLERPAQAKLLRFLQERTVERIGGRQPISVDVRMIAATHHDLEDAVAKGTFRQDLYFRLKVLSIRIPPLRERPEDVPLLVAHFLRDSGRTLAPEATEALRGHSFPGNVRELEHLLEEACVIAEGREIGVADLPDAVRGGVSPGETTHARLDVTAALLWARVVQHGDSFWDVVKEPFLRRRLSAEAVRALVERAWREGGESYKGAAEVLGIADQHKKLLDFVRNHDLGVKR